MKRFFVDYDLGLCQYSTEVNDDVLAKINRLKNGALTKLGKDDVLVRKMLILGEEPTSKLSIHPEKVLARLAKLLPGSPMMDGHRKDKVPWGRCFDAEVTNQKGYQGKVLVLSYYVLNDEDGQKRIRMVDGGILNEASISYWFTKACCSICNQDLMTWPSKCTHKLGKKDDATGQVCYWYPADVSSVAEVSYVYRGAYPKTKSMLLCAYADGDAFGYGTDQVNAAQDLEKELAKYEDQEETETGNTGNEQPENNENSPQKSPEIGDAGSDNLNQNPDENAEKPVIPVNEEEGEGTPAAAPGAGQTPEVNCESQGVEEGEVANTQATEQESYALTDEDLAFVSSMEGMECCSAEVEDLAREALGELDEKRLASILLAVSARACETGSEHMGGWGEPGRPCDNNSSTQVPEADGGGVGAHGPAGDSSLSGGSAEGNGAPTIVKHILCETCGYEREVDNAYDGTVCQECGGGLVIEECAQLFRRVGPVKPSKAGTVNNEYFDRAAFKELPDGEYAVEPKYDGVWMELHRDGDQVSLYTDEGNNVSAKFPGIVKEAKGLKSEKLILVGEMVKYRGRQRLGHEDVVSWIHRKENGDDNAFRFKPFDIVYANGESLDRKEFSVRRGLLEKYAPFGKQIHLTSPRVVKHKKGDSKVVSAIDDRKTREGAMVKDMAHTYNRAGSKMLWKWKRQAEVDAIVEKIATREGGGYVYTCGVGSKSERQTIGSTFPTKIRAAVGDVITVMVDKVTYDEATKRYTWYVPKVVARRADKKAPDPISVLKRIAVKKGSGEKDNVATLGDIVPRLLSVPRSYSLWICGGVVEYGITSNDIDLARLDEWDEESKLAIEKALGPELSSMVDFISDSAGPAGPAVELTLRVVEENVWKHANRFVLQEHGWGKKVHYDFRFGAPKTPRMWGWTCFSRPTTDAGGRKVRCVEKSYHDAKWMDVDSKRIKPGEEGNPTKNLNAWMVKQDEGKYRYIRRKPGFLELVLEGKKYKGRYLWREITVKSSKNVVENVEGDETKPKNDKIWVLWKPKDQEIGSQVKKLSYTVTAGHGLVLWESDEDDHELDAMADVEIDAQWAEGNDE